ncbi:MAG: retropepsin-like domain-containing protein [Candidatus Aenigmarchaeota archaeon]|nr:retropepsin-like domain-containing protein [Candidatus Aenigmarchaeota archaeon]
MLEFDYIEGEPIIPAILENGNKTLILDFFIDSGADMTMIPLSFARLLGFESWKIEEVENARDAGGGTVPYFVRSVQIIIGNKKLTIRIACSLQDNVPFLLGRKDIFDRFQVCFNDKDKKVVFTEL